MTQFKAFRLFQEDENAPPQGRFVTMSTDELSPGEVLIRNAYSSINYKDALAAAGINKVIRRFPRIGGIDLTGEVAASSDPRFAPGDAVIVHGFGIGVELDGGHAEYARVAADSVLKLPDGLSLREAATVGAAGYTAALSLYWMELNGLTPEAGEVLVTGATGGVASMAIDMLASRGYAVTAMSGKPAEADYLRGLGATKIVAPDVAVKTGRPIESAQWAGAVDSVGGDLLGWVLRTTKPEGVVTSFGNAAGSSFDGSVLPFILRGIKLIGINANSPMELRKMIWQRIAGECRPRHLEAIAHVIPFTDLPEAMNAMLARQTRGRTVVQFRT